MSLNPVALKEWASAVEALLRGEMIMLLRKGGIVEETRRFELKSRSFYLFPTYEHQRPELVKEAYRPLVETSFSEYDAESGRITLQAYAEAVSDLEVFDFEQLSRLEPFHMWTSNLAEERLKWKAKQPLHVLLLRVYRLKNPQVIPMLPEYGGCRSWTLIEGLPEHAERVPVLSDEAFEEQRSKIESILGNNMTMSPASSLKANGNENSV